MTRDRLEAVVQGRNGLTPYATWASRWGQGPVWLLCLAVVGLALVVRAPGAGDRPAARAARRAPTRKITGFARAADRAGATALTAASRQPHRAGPSPC